MSIRNDLDRQSQRRHKIPSKIAPDLRPRTTRGWAVNCDWCRPANANTCCGAYSPDYHGVRCTRPYRHSGDHVACGDKGPTEHPITKWPQKRGRKSKEERRAIEADSGD